jgi:protocatechuate 3,4-dioxygenase, alpha subunit
MRPPELDAKDRLLGQTPSQTVGPYFAYGLTPAQYGYDWSSIAGPHMADETTPGEHIRIEGRVFDGAGEPVTDALIEILQADSEGRHAAQPGANSAFTGFGRCGTGTGEKGRYSFSTVKPGAASAEEAPHVSLILMMRGLLQHCFTRIYFADEVQKNAGDPVLLSVPQERRHSLLATLAEPGLYCFDIHMQGENETVFFDL